jgi:Lon protease-like protein
VTDTLPMFPLGTVVFPGMLLPLQVFEPRYRALTGWCLEHDGVFGVVLIERGSEVGGGDTRFSTGTSARIVDSVALPDGRWVLAARGERRFRVERWLGEEPFPRAEVSFLDDADGGGSALQGRDGVANRFDRVLELLHDLGELAVEERPALSDEPATAAWQVAASGLLTPMDAQRLLETDGVTDRLALLTRLLDEEIEVLALRAAGG